MKSEGTCTIPRAENVKRRKKGYGRKQDYFKGAQARGYTHIGKNVQPLAERFHPYQRVDLSYSRMAYGC